MALKMDHLGELVLQFSCVSPMYTGSMHVHSLLLVFVLLICIFNFFLFINFITVTLVTKITRFQVHSSTHIICTLYCVFTTLSQVSFHHRLSPFTLHHLHSPHLLQSPHCVSMSFFFLAQSLHPPNPVPQPTQSCQPALHLWVCLYFACCIGLFIIFLIWVREVSAKHPVGWRKIYFFSATGDRGKKRPL